MTGVRRTRQGKKKENSRIIHIIPTILAIIHATDLLPRTSLRILSIHRATQSLLLNHLVDLGGRQGGKRLLGHAVVHGLALAPLLLLPHVHGLEGNGAAEKLVRHLGLGAVGVVVSTGKVKVLGGRDVGGVEVVSDGVRVGGRVELGVSRFGGICCTSLEGKAILGGRDEEVTKVEGTHDDGVRR